MREILIKLAKYGSDAQCRHSIKITFTIRYKGYSGPQFTKDVHSQTRKKNILFIIFVCSSNSIQNRIKINLWFVNFKICFELEVDPEVGLLYGLRLWFDHVLRPLHPSTYFYTTKAPAFGKKTTFFFKAFNNNSESHHNTHDNR